MKVSFWDNFPKIGWVGWLIPPPPKKNGFIWVGWLITKPAKKNKSPRKSPFLTRISPFVFPNLTKTLGIFFWDLLLFNWYLSRGLGYSMGYPALLLHRRLRHLRPSRSRDFPPCPQSTLAPPPLWTGTCGLFGWSTNLIFENFDRNLIDIGRLLLKLIFY